MRVETHAVGSGSLNCHGKGTSTSGDSNLLTSTSTYLKALLYSKALRYRYLYKYLYLTGGCGRAVIK
jgi:hypothetical protein